MAVARITVTASLAELDATASKGRFVAVPSVPVIADLSNDVLLAGIASEPFVAGTASLSLPPTDSGVNPTGYTYDLAVYGPGNRLIAQALGVTLPAGSGPWVFADLIDLAPVTDTTTYLSSLTAHLGDTTDAHDASAISFTPTGTVAATDVQAALAEADAFTPTARISATDRQSAISEVDNRFGGLISPPLTGATSAIRGTTPRVLDVWGGYVWGTHSDDIYRSADNGETWAAYNTNYPGSTLTRLLPTDDGEVIALANTTIHKSSGWGTGTVTWDLKVTANGTSWFLEWSLDGNGTKFISSQYASSRADSRYVHVSLDNGDTWGVAYDSVTEHGATLANNSHLHGVCYDPWGDRFYLSEGHDDGGSPGDVAGIYCSTDDGDTWTRATGMAAGPAPTVLVATRDGLVCGSDNAENGLYGVRRKADPADETLTQTWRWVTARDGLVGFARRGFLQPGTDTVYVCFAANFTDVAPIIAAGTPTTGGLVYTWPTLPVTANDFIGNLVLPTADTLVAYGLISGSERVITATPARPGASAGMATGNVLDGTADNATSVAIGPNSDTGAAIHSVAIGASAVADKTQGCTAIGYGATVTAQSGTAIGYGATAQQVGVAIGQGAVTGAYSESVAIGAGATSANTGTVAIGRSSSAAASGSVAIGKSASVTGASSVAVGISAVAATSSVVVGGAATGTTYDSATVIGASASVTGAEGTAVGKSATSASTGTAIGKAATVSAVGTAAVAIGWGTTASHASSVALGGQTTTTATSQVQINTRHVEFAEVTEPAAGAANSGRLYVKDNGAGKTQLCIRFNTGAVQILATEP